MGVLHIAQDMLLTVLDSLHVVEPFEDSDQIGEGSPLAGMGSLQVEVDKQLVQGESLQSVVDSLQAEECNLQAAVGVLQVEEGSLLVEKGSPQVEEDRLHVEDCIPPGM